jgi:hypothetical protein
VTAPLGEEARLLVEAAREWAARTFPEEHGSTCGWCPVCRTVAALRTPETAEKVAVAVTAATAALAAVLDAVTRPAPPADAEPGADRADIPVDPG